MKMWRSRQGNGHISQFIVLVNCKLAKKNCYHAICISALGLE